MGRELILVFLVFLAILSVSPRVAAWYGGVEGGDAWNALQRAIRVVEEYEGLGVDLTHLHGLLEEAIDAYRRGDYDIAYYYAKIVYDEARKTAFYATESQKLLRRLEALVDDNPLFEPLLEKLHKQYSNGLYLAVYAETTIVLDKIQYVIPIIWR